MPARFVAGLARTARYALRPAPAGTGKIGSVAAVTNMSTRPNPPTSGWMDGHFHVLPLRVYYEDTDFSGVVYHANYLRYMERGRSEFLRLAGVHHTAMLDGTEPMAWTIRRAVLDYKKPARVDDALLVRSRITHLSGARMTIEQSVWRGDDLLVSGHVEACIITLAGKPRRIPAEIAAKLTALGGPAKP